MGPKKSSKNSKKQFSLLKKFNQEVEKSWFLLLNSVLEDILIYHLRHENIYIFLKTKFQKITSVNVVGPDPRLLEMGEN